MPKTSKKKAAKKKAARKQKFVRKVPVPSDLDIAQAAEKNMKHVHEIAAMLDLTPDDLELHGNYKAKIHLDVLDGWKDRPDGHLIDVTAITPTPLGEGKTVTSIGLGQGMNRIGLNCCNTLREPSLGPQFVI